VELFGEYRIEYVRGIERDLLALGFFLGLTFENVPDVMHHKYGPYKSKKNHFELF